ncbi:hypothetical protein V6N12_018768, partial [Hibiscus sabdariffa]
MFSSLGKLFSSLFRFIDPAENGKYYDTRTLMFKNYSDLPSSHGGKAPVTQQLPGESDSDYSDFKSKILHLKGDRQGFEVVKSSLSAEGYDVVYDINGREAVEVEPILDALPNLEQFIYCSSAGAYLKSDILPHCESIGRVGTSLNYNPVEEWFFHRLKAGRPIPIPNSGVQITQLGHVKDLATAFVQVLGNEKASKQVFNISGEKLVDFLNPKEFDIGKKKAFPFRNQHFFASVEKAKHVLGWRPEFDLVEGLTDSYN